MAGQGLEDVVPDTLAAPPIEAVVDRLCTSPYSAGQSRQARSTEHVDDARDHPVIIDPPSSATPARQVRLDPHPSFTIQPVGLPHSRPPSENLESEHTPYHQGLLRTEPGTNAVTSSGIT